MPTMQWNFIAFSLHETDYTGSLVDEHGTQTRWLPMPCRSIALAAVGLQYFVFAMFHVRARLQAFQANKIT